MQQRMNALRLSWSSRSLIIIFTVLTCLFGVMTIPMIVASSTVPSRGLTEL